MPIQIYSIGDIKKDLSDVSRMFNSTDTLGGINSRHINSLETKFKARTNKNSIFVSSCTNGIYLILKKLNVRGKYVVIPPITFFGIASAVIKAGGIPIYSRVDKYGLMDVESVLELKQKFSIGAVVPSHINNRYVNLTDIHHLPIVEDSAPAWGLKKSDGSCVISNTPNISVISFSYGKPLTAGEGGMIFTNYDEDWYRGQRYCGLDNLDGQYGYGSFNVVTPELKLANTGLNAAIIMNKLRNFDQNLNRCKQIAKHYNDCLSQYHECEWYESGNNQTYTLLTDKKEYIINFLNENEIKSYSSHRPVFYNDAFNFDGANNFKYTSERYFNKILHIPCRYDLTDQEVNYITDTLLKAFK